jgi:hypothetical protein
MRTKKISLQLEVSYSEAELTEKRDHLAAVIVEIGAIEQRKVSVAKTFKEELDGLYSDSSRLAHQIRRKSEERSVECKVIYDSPNIGEKTVVRLDTGEQVRVEPMSQDEQQEEIEFVEQQEKQEIDRQVKGLLDSVTPPTQNPPQGDQPPEAA